MGNTGLGDDLIYGAPGPEELKKGEKLAPRCLSSPSRRMRVAWVEPGRPKSAGVPYRRTEQGYNLVPFYKILQGPLRDLRERGRLVSELRFRNGETLGT
jgi:hypothetical protein